MPHFDPELAPALALLTEVMPFAILPSMNSSLRTAIAEQRLSAEELARGGEIGAAEHRIPGGRPARPPSRY
ncbi:hypothetical protein [Streptomyces sp. NBC_00826]|uniref:hypothetical protein n=1 Tax=Streptomyces sp. NBC_00826 TaxID=2975845 RepID=UPI003868187D